MKKNAILNIARVELKMMFSTPVAWIMLIVFAMLCGLFFMDVFRLYVESQASGSGLSFITEGMFASDSLGLFPKVQAYLFLFIPMVTMGLLSRDLSSGTIKLMYSSPVTDTQIVLGKFVAMVGYSLAMMGVVLMYVIFAGFAVQSLDFPHVLTGLLGLFLLSCTYSAIGLFMSSLTSYQVVAALSTFAVLAGLSYVRDLWQEIVWVRDITWWLSISGRCEEFIRGLICSEDLIYFVMVSALFLSLAIMRTSNRRKARSAGRRFAGYMAAVVITCAVAFLSSRPQLMWFHDSTETKRQTITVPSQEIMARVEGPVTMTSYVNILDEDGFYLGVPSRFNSDKAYIKQYLRFKPDIKIRYEYYWADAGSKSVRRRFPDLTDAERAERLADIYEMNINKFQSPEQIAQKIDLSDERYRLVRHIEMEDGRSTFLRIFDDSQRLPQEKEITAAFKRLVDGAITVGMVTGHDERDIYKEGDKDYYAFATAKSFRHSLLNNGFDVVNVDLNAEIPQEVEILIIADPREVYSAAELAALQGYIDSGRNLILAVEPGRNEVNNSIAALVGARFDEGRLVNPPGDNMQNLTLGDVTEDAVKRMPSLRELRRHGSKITMPDATGIRMVADKGYRVETLLQSDTTVWNELQTTDFENLVATCDGRRGEKVGAVDLALQLEKDIDSTRVQKILLLGDADCFSNSELMRQRYAIASGNFSLLYEVFRWLSDGQYPIATPRAKGSDNSVYVEVEQIPVIRWIFLAIIPLLMLLSSIIIIVRRKSR